MKSLILSVTAKIVFPILVIASFLVLFRGHHEPGGGFIGGLVFSCAFILYIFALGLKETEKILPLDPLNFITWGLIIAISAGLIGLFAEGIFFKALFVSYYLPIIGKLSTPLLFDVGVFFVVVGVTLKIVFAISKEE